jgi:hypothetical protein
MHLCGALANGLVAGVHDLDEPATAQCITFRNGDSEM